MKLFGINAKFGRISSFFLSVILFAVCVGGYIIASELRHAENPSDKVMPTISQIGTAFYRSVAETDKRTGDRQLLVDTLTSGRRFLISVAILFGGVIIGLQMGVFPFWEKFLHKFVTFLDKVPAMCVLPMLFIIFGLEETSKVALIVIGVMPTIILDTFHQAQAVHRGQLIKGLTLGASDDEIAYRIILPQIFPKVLDTIRLNLKSVMLFLIAGEALAATVGLGYRIFVVRRYMAMDIIIAYVLWMSILLFLTDWGLRLWIKWRYPWLKGGHR